MYSYLCELLFVGLDGFREGTTRIAIQEWICVSIQIVGFLLSWAAYDTTAHRVIHNPPLDMKVRVG